MGAISEEQQEKLAAKLYDTGSGDEETVPTVRELKRHYAVLLDELMYRIRDKIDNGNVDEVSRLVASTEHIDQLMYAIEGLMEDKVERFVSKSDLEDIVDRAVEKVHEKMQAEEKNAVAAKLKLNAALAAKSKVAASTDPLDAPDK